jgi:hypothetical protein
VIQKNAEEEAKVQNMISKNEYMEVPASKVQFKTDSQQSQPSPIHHNNSQEENQPKNTQV